MKDQLELEKLISIKQNMKKMTDQVKEQKKQQELIDMHQFRLTFTKMKQNQEENF